MTLVAPPSARATVQETPAGLEVVVPGRRNWFVAVFLGLWLCGWAMGEVTVPVMFAQGKVREAGAELFLIVWFLGWTLGGSVALYSFGWLVSGRERVVFSATRIGIKCEVFGLGRMREYDAAHVRALRFSAVPANPFDFRHALTFWGGGGGLLSFDYGATTVRFGAGIEESEAKSLAAEIRRRVPYTAVE